MKPIYILLLLFPFLSLWADRIEVPSGDYEIQIPVGWTIFDRSDLTQLSFISDDDSSILQISYFPGESYQSLDQMYETLISELNGQGEESRFPYLQWNAWLSDLSFQLSGENYRGWFLLLDGEKMDYQISLFTAEIDYKENFPWMISALDAFSPGSQGARNSGIISALMQIGTSELVRATQQMGQFNFEFEYDLNRIEASQAQIEREAQLLNQYNGNENLFRLAWERYYNLVFRESYSALIPFFEKIEPIRNSMKEDEFIDFILEWLQGFEYASSDTFSDLLSPINALVSSKGDCDSLALLYLMILEYYEIDGLLMVSNQYSHAMAAVESEKEGASFIFDGKRYLVAEMTDQVALGQIASTMSDLEKWQFISF